MLTNSTLEVVNVQSVEVLDGGSQEVLLLLEGAALQAAIVPLGTPPPEKGDVQTGPTALPVSSASVVWLDVQLPLGAPPPATLEHRVIVFIGGRLQPAFGGIAPVQRTPGDPIVLGPPVLSGNIWYASDGGCTHPTHHRRGLAPINGALLVPQRFAIDWFMLDSRHRAWVGDPRKFSSYLTFEQAVIASANGTVVDVQNGLMDNPKLPASPDIPPIQDTVGNHVTLKVEGTELYLLYAHLERGTIMVHEKQPVSRGDILGLVGSSGNSTTPHLHFQVMTTATFFPTDSPPFVFDSFDLLGTITKRIWDDNLGLQPDGMLPFQPVSYPGERANTMPLDRDVVRF